MKLKFYYSGSSREKDRKKMVIQKKYIIGGILGVIAGYTYYHFWGCTNGCPLRSNWMIMTGYGGAVGLVVASYFKKKELKNDDDNLKP